MFPLLDTTRTNTVWDDDVYEIKRAKCCFRMRNNWHWWPGGKQLSDYYMEIKQQKQSRSLPNAYKNGGGVHRDREKLLGHLSFIS